MGHFYEFPFPGTYVEYIISKTIIKEKSHLTYSHLPNHKPPKKWIIQQLNQLMASTFRET